MKKLITGISVLLMMCFICHATAFGALSDEDASCVDEVPDCADGYSKEDYLYCPDEDISIISGDVADADLAFTAASNGYDTIEFTIPDTQCEVYLTGIKDDIRDRVTQTITGLYQRGMDFNLTEEFIDAEKTREPDDDDNMCWAASTANVLRYTGWGFEAGFATEDDIFEDFIRNFENKTGSANHALAWFFNGLDLARDAYQYYGSHGHFAKVKNYPRSGGYLKDYPFDSYVERIDMTGRNSGAGGMKIIYELLHRGYGVVLNTDVYLDGRYRTGHSVTCWGMIVDNQYPDTEKEHYRYILISNSDSDQVSGMDRRKAKNIVSAYRLSPFKMGGEDSFSFNFDVRQMGIISDIVALAPYIAGPPVETDPDATRDRLNTVDFLSSEILLTDSPDSEESKNHFEIGENVFYGFVLKNMSSVPFEGRLPYEFILKDENDHVVKTIKDKNVIVDICSDDDIVWVFGTPFKALKGGTYTLTLTWNPNHSINEAFFFNNTQSATFSVGEPYLTGDVDNDGVISVVDSLYIRRMLAQIETNLDHDKKAKKRGDVDSSGHIDLTDATMIEYYCVRLRLKMGVHVNERAYY